MSQRYCTVGKRTCTNALYMYIRDHEHVFEYMRESLWRRTSIGSNDLPRSKCNDTFPLEHSPDLSYRCIELFFAKAELRTRAMSANRDLRVYRKRLFFNSLVIYFFYLISEIYYIQFFELILINFCFHLFHLFAFFIQIWFKNLFFSININNKTIFFLYYSWIY